LSHRPAVAARPNVDGLGDRDVDSLRHHRLVRLPSGWYRADPAGRGALLSEPGAEGHAPGSTCPRFEARTGVRNGHPALSGPAPATDPRAPGRRRARIRWEAGDAGRSKPIRE